MKEVSIEYAHIYSNSKIHEEHELSLKVLKEVRQSSESLVVMVDDYSFPDPTFNYGMFVEWLTAKGYPPHLVIRESQLIPQCDEVLRIMNEDRLKDEIVTYIQEKKYPCSLFIASWYLLRLGILEHPSFPKSEYAKRLINILPESFRSFEEKGFEIIRSTAYAEALERIENKYFEGRIIA